MNDSQAQLDYLREYTPDVVAALTNLGQAGAYYDANGHYRARSRSFGAFGLDASNQLTDKPPSHRYQGLQVVHGRCPGGAVQPPPDRSAPVQVAGCNPLDDARRDHEAARADRVLAGRRGRRHRAVARTGSSRGAGRRTRSARSSTTPRSPCPARTSGSPAPRRHDPVARRHRRPAPRGGDDLDQRRALHAVPRQRDLRDPPAVADRRALRRLHPGSSSAPALTRSAAPAPAATPAGDPTSSPVDSDIVQDIYQQPIRSGSR